MDTFNVIPLSLKEGFDKKWAPQLSHLDPNKCRSGDFWQQEWSLLT